MAIPLFKVFMSEDVIQPVNTVLRSGYVTQGKQVEKYEDALRNFNPADFPVDPNDSNALNRNLNESTLKKLADV